MSFGAEAPYDYYLVPAEDREARTMLGSDQCLIDDQRCYVRGQLELPVVGSDQVFTWGVWLEVPLASFERMDELWEVEGREAEPPYTCTVATALPVYPSTLGLRALLATRPLGLRPAVMLEPSDHPLSREQQEGINWERVHALVSVTLHGPS